MVTWLTTQLVIDRITGRQRPGILRVPRPWRIEWNRRPIVTELIVLHVCCVDSIGGRVVYHRRMLLVGEVLLGIRYVVLIVSRCCRVATRMWMTRWKKRLFLTHSAVVPGRTYPTCNIKLVYLLASCNLIAKAFIALLASFPPCSTLRLEYV